MESQRWDGHYTRASDYLYQKAHDFSFSASCSLSLLSLSFSKSSHQNVSPLPSCLVSLDSTRLKAPLEESEFPSPPPSSLLPPFSQVFFFPRYLHFLLMFSCYKRIRKRKKYSKVSKRISQNAAHQNGLPYFSFLRNDEVNQIDAGFPHLKVQYSSLRY